MRRKHLGTEFELVDVKAMILRPLSEEILGCRFVTAHGKLAHQLPGELDLIRIDGMEHDIKTSTAHLSRFVWKQTSL